MFTVEQVIESLDDAQKAINKAFEMLEGLQNLRPEMKKRIEARTKPFDSSTMAPAAKKRKKNEPPVMMAKDPVDELMNQVINQDEEVPQGVIVVDEPGQILPSKKDGPKKATPEKEEEKEAHPQPDDIDTIIHEKPSCSKLRTHMVNWLKELVPLPVTEEMDHFIALVDISKQMSAQDEYITRMGNHYPKNIKIVKRILLALPTDGFRKQLDKEGNPPKRNKQFGFYVNFPFY